MVPTSFRPQAIMVCRSGFMTRQTECDTDSQKSLNPGSEQLDLASLLSDITPVLASHPTVSIAAISLGSNLGDRFANIELALRLLETPGHVLGLSEDAEVTVTDTSFLYETAPMYVTDQPSFINCACLVRIYLFDNTVVVQS